ncbi:hypothetical protein ACRAKI_01315 [Saccharothrix isguenensis]
MTGSRGRDLGWALTVVSRWALAGVLLVIGVALTWYFVATRHASDRAREVAEASANRAADRLVDDLRAAVADGGLDDAEVEALDRARHPLVAVSRDPDRVVLTFDVRGYASGLLANDTTVTLCSVNEVSPATAAVTRRDGGAC